MSTVLALLRLLANSNGCLADQKESGGSLLCQCSYLPTTLSIDNAQFLFSIVF